MKIPVKETTTKEVEVAFPIYGFWEDDLEDGRISWETRFAINEQLQLRTVTQWQGGRAKWEIGLDQLHISAVGGYLKHKRISAAHFLDFVEQALRRFDVGGVEPEPQ